MFDAATDARVRRELVNLLYDDLPLATCAGALLVPTLTLLRWPSGDKAWLIAWAGAQLWMHALAALCCVAFRRSAGRDPELWLRRAAHLHTVVFAMWGVGFAGFISPDAPQVTAVGVAVASFVGAFMLTGVFPTPFAGAVNNMLLLLPTALRCASFSGHLYQGIALLIALNLATAAPRSRRLHEVFARSIALRLQNEDMAVRVERAKERAEHALLTRSRFVAAASHDLRQPLHAMGLFIDLLAAEPLATRPRAFVEHMRSATAAVMNLLQSLLDLSCIDAQAVPIERRAFALQGLFAELAAQTEPALRAKGLQLSVAMTDAIIDSDPLQLARILRNLLANSVRYSERGTIKLAAHARANEIEIRVVDEGPGIPAEARSKIFEEFYQLPRAGEHERDRGGLGLGLSIVQGLARLLEHRVELSSQTGPDSGTCVSIFVPRAPAAIGSAATQLAAACNVLAGHSALVVDDEPAICEALCELLESWQCSVRRAGSVSQAVAAVSQHGVPDVMICDYQLSDGQTGLDVLRALEHDQTMPVHALWVTGDTTSNIELRPLLLKPIDPSRLRAMLTALLHKGLTAPQGPAVECAHKTKPEATRKSRPPAQSF